MELLADEIYLGIAPEQEGEARRVAAEWGELGPCIDMICEMYAAMRVMENDRVIMPFIRKDRP